MTTAPIDIVVLAAGQGTRMKSALPKVLHPLAGKPLLGHVIETARELGPRSLTVVYGHGGDAVPQAMENENIRWVRQEEQLGTGHAVDQAMPGLEDDGLVLVLYGDVPLVRPESLRGLVARADAGNPALLTVTLDNPTGYGRIIRDADGAVTAIVEQKDATDDQLRVREANTGIMCVPAAQLRRWLGALDNSNAQGEYYLTDIVAAAVGDGTAVLAETLSDADEVLGVNDRVQLAHLERVYQSRRAEALMRNGATLVDPARVDIRGSVDVGRDVFIDVNVVFEGSVRLGDGVRIGANCVLKDVVVEQGATCHPMTIAESATIGAGCSVGPFARLRPGTVLADAARVGNFVETKNARIGSGSKVNHLSYIGDTVMGVEVNIGAGTITCNYDGANKHQTVIGDRVFVGSDTQLVAPVTVQPGATIGAGSTITRDAPEGELTLSRSKQMTIPGWKRPEKKGS